MSKSAFPIALAFAASGLFPVHGAEPWEAGRGGGAYTVPPAQSAPAFGGTYSQGSAGTPQVGRASPFDAFRPEAAASPSRPGAAAAQPGADAVPAAPAAPAPRAPTPPATAAFQTKLEGNWRGTAGEYVEIRGNQARVWSEDGRSCFCIFMLHGNRMIAYSPDTDVVKKFEYGGGGDRFVLRDERGGSMSFERAR